MLTLGYASTGHFEGALREFESTDELLSSILAARNLVMRETMVWTAVLAVLTVSGWLG